MLAVLAVICLHASAHWVVFEPDHSSVRWWTGNLVNSLVRWCVPVFVMVTGALLLPRVDTLDVRAFWRRRLWRLVPVVLFWSLLYLVLRRFEHPDEPVRDLARALLRGEPSYHLWYVYMLVGLYAVLPLLARAVQGVAPQVLWTVVILGFAVAALEIDRVATVRSFAARFVSFVPYVLSGAALVSVLPPRHTGWRWLLLVLALGCALATAGLTYWMWPSLGYQTVLVIYDYLNPLIVVMSLAWFAYLMTSRYRARWVRLTGPLALGVYLIHPLWLGPMHRWAGHWLEPWPPLHLLVSVVGVFVASSLCVALMRAVPGLRRVVT